MMSLFRIGPLILLAPIAVYFFFYFKRSLGFWKVPVKKLWVKLLIAAVCALLMAASASIWSVNLIIIMHWFFLCVLVQLICCVLRLAFRRNEKARQKVRSIYASGLVPVGLTIIVILLGYWNMNRIVEKDYTIYTQKDIREEGYQVVFISDMHFGISISLEELSAYAAEIEAQKPDLVLLGGDIVDESTTKENLQKVFSVLGGIQSTYGTYYVYGNHDRARYSDRADFNAVDLQKAIQDAGVRILSDDVVVINDEFTLVGREDASMKANRAQSAKLLAAADQTDFILLLDHQPRDLEANQAAGVDLQLSGHTHNGQIWPAGLISSAFQFNEMTYGYEKLGNFQVIVSSGIAGWGYPIRTSGNSEYLVLSIKPE